MNINAQSCDEICSVVEWLVHLPEKCHSDVDKCKVLRGMVDRGITGRDFGVHVSRIRMGEKLQPTADDR